LPPRIPASEVIITLGVASSIRVARLAAAKAAEDHRVDRADARAGEHGERGLGDHRHVDQHASPRPTSCAFSTAANRFTSRQARGRCSAGSRQSQVEI
jgi:hypothetical protein